MNFSKKKINTIIVYTADENDSAINLYTKKGMIREYYSNVLESDEINNGTIVFSKSLTLENTKKWNNKFLQLAAQVEKEK